MRKVLEIFRKIALFCMPEITLIHNIRRFFRKMISRRLLRIKIMQILFAYFKTEGSSLNKFESQLFFSINKSYDLYHYLLLLITEIADYASARIEIAKQKRIPTSEDLDPNTRFINNRLIHQIRNNESLQKYINEHKLSWVNDPGLIKKLYEDLTGSDYYRQYMKLPGQEYEEDKKFVINIYDSVIAQNNDLIQTLEEQSIFWNDEFEFVINMITKTLKLFQSGQHDHASLMPLYKNDEDKDFVKQLFRKVIIKRDEYLELIREYTQNWDIERIAFIDVLIMEMAIAEVLEFPSIPVKVTFNEYLELAKYYSTNKSSFFINGILDKIFEKLKKENKIKKHGRGLIGEV